MIRKKYIKAPVRDLVLEFPYNTDDSVSGKVYPNYSGTIYSQTSDGGVISGLTIKKNSIIQSFPFIIEAGDLLEINFDYTSDKGTIFLNGINDLRKPLKSTITYKPNLMLDKFKNAAVGYSLRKLRNDYTGPAIRVIRDSDNEYADIALINGELDVSGLLSWLNGDTGLVHTWYFQGLPSEGVDAVQVVKANMPRIVHNGVIEELNGKPALNFMNNQFFDLGGDARYNTGAAGTYGYVVASLRVHGNHGLFGRSIYANSGQRVCLYSDSGLGITSVKGTSPSVANSASLPPPLVDTQAIMYQLIRGNNNTVGVNDMTKTDSKSHQNSIIRHYFIGAYGNASGSAPQTGFYLDGKMQELVQFYNDKLAVQLDIRDEINNYYGSY